MKRNLIKMTGNLQNLTLNTTPNNFFPKPTLSILHQAIKLTVYFKPFLLVVTGFILTNIDPSPKSCFKSGFKLL